MTPQKHTTATTLTRRGAIALTAASYSRVHGANDRIQVGFAGYGLIGAQHVFDFKNQRDVDMAAMCDVHQPRLEQGVAACGGKAKPYKDFRRMLENKELGAIVVSTPDHWHALQTMMACAAGKDVYCEKPLTLFVREGRWMTTVARKYNRIVQVGTQQRSGPHYQKARDLLKSGYIGKLHSVRMSSFRNIMPGFGSPVDDTAPSEFDYDLWLGPAPARPYNSKRGLYHFRWFWDYSGGQMTNLGAHSIDIIYFSTGLKGPRSVMSTGGRFALQDTGDTPDTQDSLFDFGDGLTAIWSHREAAAGRRSSGAGGLEFFGTKGSLSIGRGGFEVTPEMKGDPADKIPQFKGHTAGGPARSNTAPEPYIQAMKEAGSADQQFDLHARNFLDCIKSRQRPIADVEDGHRVATACHLANMSLRLGRSIRWDAEKEVVIGDAEAANMLERPYRKPWDSVLKSLLS